jgi:hypothetical protein
LDTNLIKKDYTIDYEKFDTRKLILLNPSNQTLQILSFVLYQNTHKLKYSIKGLLTLDGSLKNQSILTYAIDNKVKLNLNIDNNIINILNSFKNFEEKHLINVSNQEKITLIFYYLKIHEPVLYNKFFKLFINKTSEIYHETLTLTLSKGSNSDSIFD